MNTEYSVRQLEVSEYLQAMELCSHVYLTCHGDEPEELKKMVTDAFHHPKYTEGMLLYGAFHGDRLVGVTGVRQESNYMTVNYVLPEMQGKGISSFMFNFLKKERLGFGPIWGLAHPSAMDKYRHQGWVASDEPVVMDGIGLVPIVYMKYNEYKASKCERQKS